MKTTAFASELEKLAFRRTPLFARAIEAVSGGAAGAALGLGAAKATGKTGKWDEEETGGTLGGAAAGTAAALLASHGIRSQLARKALKEFKHSKKYLSAVEAVADGSPAMQRPEIIKAQIAAVDTMDDYPQYFKDHIKAEGWDPKIFSLARDMQSRNQSLHAKLYKQLDKRDALVQRLNQHLQKGKDTGRLSSGLDNLEDLIRDTRDRISAVESITKPADATFSRAHTRAMAKNQIARRTEKARLDTEMSNAQEKIKELKEAHKEMLRAARASSRADVRNKIFGLL